MGKETLIILLTRRFPFHPGEQFLEEEIDCWAKYFEDEVLILPSESKGVPREIPKGIGVQRLDNKQTRSNKLFLAVNTLFSSLFIKEIVSLIFSRKEFKYGLFKIAFLTSYRVLFFASLYEKILGERLKRGVVIYSYWNSVESYAAALLKKRRKRYKIKLVSRAHGFDVYEERRTYGYMPLKWQFKDSFDKVLAISEQGKSYLHRKYQLQNISVERLGVSMNGEVCAPTDDGKVVILSLSYCTIIKRIDRIIKSIKAFKLANPKKQVVWHHIGDGIELINLKKMSEELLSPLGVKWMFHGDKGNSEVHEFLKVNKIDVLINASESEGVPVSIMEAMSYGIPAIAPNVGGISELITLQNGILLSSSPSEQEFVSALEKEEFYKSVKVREAARKYIEANYNATINYRRLIDVVTNS